ncbi:Phage tail fiber protein, partial [hydrothermal vent metagenome]
MKTTKRFFTYGLLVLSMVFTSCSKDGDIGPQGEQGIAGQDGNANVTSVVLRDISLPSNSTSTFNVPELTQEILDEGLVVVHINLNTTASFELWSPLPVELFNEIVRVRQIRVGEID